MKRTRIVTLVSTLCICLALFATGVWAAVSTVNFSLNGNLKYYPEGLFVTLSGQVYRGSSSIDADMEAIKSDPRFTYGPVSNFDSELDEISGNFPIETWNIGAIGVIPNQNYVKIEVDITNYSEFPIKGTPTITLDEANVTIVSNNTDDISMIATNETVKYKLIFEITASTEINKEIEISFDFEETEYEIFHEYFTYSSDHTAITGLSDTYKNLEVKPETLIIPSTDGEGNKITTISGTSGMIEIVFPFEDLESSNIIIEEGITTIGREAFASCVSITSVTIPSTITAWEPTVDASLSGYNNAFSDCDYLSNITLAEGLTTLGDYAFNNCTSLTSVTIPSSVSSFGTHIFNGCTNLESISLTSSENLLNIHGDSTFEGCSNIINEENNVEYLINTTENGVDKYLIAVGFATEEVTTVEINPNCKYLAYGLCLSNRNITSISLPTGLIGIGAWAFANCTNLTSITIPEGITSIKTSTFSNCSALTNITLPSTLTNIESSAFSHCDSLVSITIPEKVVSIGRNTFFSCDNLKNVTFADPNNWRVYESSSDETGIGLTLSTSSSAARYLKSTYRMYTWKKL